MADPKPSITLDKCKELYILADRSMHILDERLLDHSDHFTREEVFGKHGPTFNYCNDNCNGMHEIADYDGWEDVLWPAGDRIDFDSFSVFTPPTLPDGEEPFSFDLTQESLRRNPNVVGSGPSLGIHISEQNIILNVFAAEDLVLPRRHPLFPISGENPIPLLLTEVKPLSTLFDKIQNSHPDFLVATVIDREREMLNRFEVELNALLYGHFQASLAKPYFGRRGNRGWYHVMTIAFAPFFRRLQTFDPNNLGDWTPELKKTLHVLLKAMCWASFATSKQFRDAGEAVDEDEEREAFANDSDD